MSTPSQTAPEKVSWLNILCGLFLVTMGVVRLFKTNYRWMTWVGLFVGVLMLAIEWFKWRNARSQAAESSEDAPLRSLVFLLEEPRAIESARWVTQIGEALGVSLNADGKKSTEFVMPMPDPAISAEDGDCFMLKIRHGVFWIFNIRKPYMDDPEGYAETIPDGRLRSAIARHRAWISVDLLHWNGTDDRDAVYAVIGRVLASLSGPDVVAVNAPELGRCNEFDPSLIEKLASGKPLEIFDEPTFSPVISIEGDDPEMAAAKAEAKRRWPEFVAQFSKRKPGSDRPFIVKAPFGKNEEEEFMWVLVERIEDDLVSGKLGNQPNKIVDLHEAQEVTIPVGAVIDWLCADASDEPLGGWTNKVLAKRAGQS